MIVRFWIASTLIVYRIEADILETTGFHCKHSLSMRLDRAYHGTPHITLPPFEFTVLDDDNNPIEYYEPGVTYRSVRHQYCDDSQSNDTLTHSDNKKKFLVEALWTTERDIGAVQFLLTVAAEDVLYWERWRPRSGFIRPKWAKHVKVVESLFKIEVPPGGDEPTLSPEELKTTVPPEELTTVEPFDPKLFEEIEAAEESESNRLKSAETLIALNSAITVIPFSTQGSFATQAASTSVLVPSTPVIASTDINPPPSDEANITEATRRVYKKYSPSTEDRLGADDIKFLNAHTHLVQHDFVDTDTDPEEICRHANPCANGGICSVKNSKVHCECAKGFAGENCTDRDMCINNACANNSTCRNGPKGTYICDCLENTVGTYCQFRCAPDQCSGNGECIMRFNGKIGCKCEDGMTGLRCDRERDECKTAKCVHSLKCVDKFNDYECVCEDGWMGKNCERPCQDIYGSCKIWKREGQCEIPPEETKFFSSNCPLSCEKCVPRNDTMKSFDRLPAILLPLSWLLGEWHAEVKGFKHRSFDYPMDFNATGYTETLSFTVAKPLMFGTPSINFTCRAVSNDDATDVHEQNGFLTIRQYPPMGEKTLKVALSSVNNQGVILVEEGPLTDEEGTGLTTITVSPQYVKMYEEELERFPSLSPETWVRSFTRKGPRLIQSVSRETEGRKLRFKKLYQQIREPDFL
ncbi:hypothetical protein Q1695_012027 [Nippostrongylus brasiliensis]|nr:hypothetical protein Q1695_012027 [Nippostrongylus brasiliensis]